MTEQSDHTIEEFVERLGLVAQADGMPRIAGRILGLFVIYGGPFSSAELVERLKVSRGSISTNSRFLEHLGVIERVARPGDRQDYFQMRPEPYIELLKGSQSRLCKARAVVTDAQRKLPENWADAQTRLDELATFYTKLIQGFEAITDPKAK